MLSLEIYAVILAIKFFLPQNDVTFASFSLAEYFRNHRPDSIQGIIGPSSAATTERIAYIVGNNYELFQVKAAVDLPMQVNDCNDRRLNLTQFHF